MKSEHANGLKQGVNKSRPNGSAADRKKHGRSRLTNSNAYLPRGITDGRSTWARRFRDLVELHLADRGGADQCSEGLKALIRRAACLIVEAERLEVQFAQNGGATLEQLETYQRVTSALRRLLESIGLERAMNDITEPRTADEFIRAHRHGRL